MTFFKLKLMIVPILLALFVTTACDNTETPEGADIEGFGLLEQLNGVWIGSNQTAFGPFEWFVFDYRPISPSHMHAIYEGATQQNIIASFFVADFDGKQQIMCRNGGWLFGQYRATYFVLDQANEGETENKYRLVDAVGGENRSYIELTFKQDSMLMDAYTSNSGTLSEPVKHMGFRGILADNTTAQTAIDHFDFPKAVSEVDLNSKFSNVEDPNTAMFLNEADDPFRESEHGYISTLEINFERATAIENEPLLLFLSTEPIIEEGVLSIDNLNTKVVRTIDIAAGEAFYKGTYIHPGDYYLTAFSDADGNQYPTTGDYVGVSEKISIVPESEAELMLSVTVEMQ